MLPQASVAFQVRSLPAWPVQLATVPASVEVIAVSPPEALPILAVPVLAGAVEAPQASTLSAGQVITGSVVSAKVMCCTQLAKLPQASVAFQVRSIPAWPVQLAAVPASVNVMAEVDPKCAVEVAVPVLA